MCPPCFRQQLELSNLHLPATSDLINNNTCHVLLSTIPASGPRQQYLPHLSQVSPARSTLDQTTQVKPLGLPLLAIINHVLTARSRFLKAGASGSCRSERFPTCTVVPLVVNEERIVCVGCVHSDVESHRAISNV